MLIGIYKDLSNEVYHKDEAISRSGIMMYKQSPLKYWAHYINPDRPQKKTTDAMKLGSAFHTMILEPHLFDEQYVVEPPRVYLKDSGRILYEAYKANLTLLEFTNKILLTKEEMQLLENMKESLENNITAWQLVNGGVNECSYFWEDEETGLRIKSRPDIVHQSMIVDLKTTGDNTTRAYQRDMIDGGYHLQGAMAIDALYKLEKRYIDSVINVCVEKTYPFSVAIKLISIDALKHGQREYKMILQNMKSSIENHNFEDYAIELVELPAWAL